MSDKEKDGKNTIDFQSYAGGGKPDKLREVLRDIHSNMEVYIEMMEVNSKLQRQKYNSLIEQGFSESQAIELCKSI